MDQIGYFNTETWEFIPIEKMEPGEYYWLNTPEQLELAKLYHELNLKAKHGVMWGK